MMLFVVAIAGMHYLVRAKDHEESKRLVTSYIKYGDAGPDGIIELTIP